MPGVTEGGSAPVMPLCQIAMSATHLLRTHHWYQRALGFLSAGHRRHRDIPGHAAVSDLPESSFDVWCLVDQQQWFQFEIFEFERPRMRPMPSDWRPCDMGYSTIGIHVADFDEALERLLRTSGRPLSEPIGPAGRRRVCLRDPEGILLELMEDDFRSSSTQTRLRTEVPAVVRFITLSVPDLDRARRFWVDAVGLVEATGLALHGPEHEMLWGLAGATRHALLLWAGDVLVELVQYIEPAGKPRPAGYLLSDQGILNLALGSTTRRDFDEQYCRIRSCGYRSTSEPWTVAGVATVVYIDDGQGFSVELLHVEPDALEEMGFVAARDPTYPSP